MTATRPSVVLIDDHEIFREWLEALLTETYEVIGVGATSEDAIRFARIQNPDLLILDVELASDPAEKTFRTVRRMSPGIVVVVLRMFENLIPRRQLLPAGASDYLTKAIGRHELSVRLRTALLIVTAASRQADRELSDLLSPRAPQVITLIDTAATHKDIAIHLSLSEATVKRHIANIYHKIGASSRIEAVTKASRLGLL